MLLNGRIHQLGGSLRQRKGGDRLHLPKCPRAIPASLRAPLFLPAAVPNALEPSIPWIPSSSCTSQQKSSSRKSVLAAAAPQGSASTTSQQQQQQHQQQAPAHVSFDPIQRALDRSSKFAKLLELRALYRNYIRAKALLSMPTPVYRPANEAAAAAPATLATPADSQHDPAATAQQGEIHARKSLGEGSDFIGY